MRHSRESRLYQAGSLVDVNIHKQPPVSAEGQLDACGRLPSALVSGSPTQFAVLIQLDQSELRLPGGAQGQAAIYTENIPIAGIPVMFLIRANNWLNYLR